MKQMNLLRVGVLLVAALFVVGAFTTGGFAKYITGNQGHDAANVAMFGVTLSVGGNSFANQYVSTNTVNHVAAALAGKENDTKTTVWTATTDKILIAPGTSSAIYNGSTAKFGINGTPEVAVKVDVSFDQNNTKDVFLAPGVYTDYTHVNSSTHVFSDTFTVESPGYYPVKYTLSQDINGTKTPIVTDINLTSVGTYLNGYSANATYGPGVDLNANFSLDWEWKFENESEGSINDQADTLLGMLATPGFQYQAYSTTNKTMENVTLNNTDYSLGLEYNLAVSVEQID